MKKNLPFNLFLILTVAVVLSGCGGGSDGSGGGSSGYAPDSLVGKTIKLGSNIVYWTFKTSSTATLNFSSSYFTYTTVGTPSYSYSVTGSNSATLKLSYTYTKKRSSANVNQKWSYEYDLTLSFSNANYGTVSGSSSYTLVDYEDDETSNGVNVISDKAFTVVE